MTKWKLLGGYSPALILHLKVLRLLHDKFHGPQGGNFLSVPCTSIWVWRTAEMAKMTKLGVVPCNYQKLDLHQTGTATTLPQDRLCGIAQLKNTQIYLDQSIQWLYLRQSILCCTVPVSTLFSWAGRPCLAAFSVLIFQLLLLLTILVLLLSCLMGAQNMPCSEVPPKLWMQLCGYPQRCREDSLESFPGAAGSDSMGPTWISSCPVTPGSPSTCASLCTRPPVQSSQGHQDSGEEVTGEEV